MKNPLILFICLNCCTVPSYAQMSIKHEGPLKELFSIIQNKYGYNFMYSNDEVNDRQQVSVNVENQGLDVILAEVFTNKNISFEIIKKQVILKRIAKSQYIIAESVTKVQTNAQPMSQPAYNIQQVSENGGHILPPDTNNTKPEFELVNTTNYSDPIPMIEALTITNIYHENKIIDIMKNKYALKAIIQSESEPKLKKQTKSTFALHTNLLYDLILIPNIGGAFRFNETLSININGYWTHINWENDAKTYRLWEISPELRFYFTAGKKFYTGTMFQIGALNLKLGETGRQGDFIGGSVLFGYWINVSRNLKLDFGIGIGYIHYKYDTYQYADGINVKEKSNNKNIWGPTKAGITLVWDIKHSI